MWWSGNSDASFLWILCFLIHFQLLQQLCRLLFLYSGETGFALGLNKDDSRIALPDYDKVSDHGPEDAEILMTLLKHQELIFTSLPCRSRKNTEIILRYLQHLERKLKKRN
jgi:hypothetical protein